MKLPLGGALLLAGCLLVKSEHPGGSRGHLRRRQQAPGLSILSPFSSSSHGPTAAPTNGLPANVVWNVSLGGPVTARPLTSPDGRRIFVPVNHTLLALQSGDGSQLWSTEVEGPIRGMVMSGDGARLYINVHNSGVYAVGTQDGQSIWRYEPLDAIRGSPTLSADGHVVYLVGSMRDSVGGEYEGVGAVNASTGAEIFLLGTHSALGTGGALSPRILVSNHTAALPSSSPSSRLGNSSLPSPPTSPSLLSNGSSGAIASNASAHPLVVNGTNGGFGKITPPPLPPSNDTMIFVLDANLTVYAIRTDGLPRMSKLGHEGVKPKWVAPGYGCNLQKPVMAQALSPDGSVLYAPTVDGIRALRTADGTELWQSKIDALDLSSPMVLANYGVFLYALTSNGIPGLTNGAVKAVDTRDGGLAGIYVAPDTDTPEDKAEGLVSEGGHSGKLFFTSQGGKDIMSFDVVKRLAVQGIKGPWYDNSTASTAFPLALASENGRRIAYQARAWATCSVLYKLELPQLA